MFTPKKMFAIFRVKGGLCYYCGENAETLDHFIPRVKGGSDSDENLVPTCSRCNIRKNSRTLEHFRQIEIRRINHMPRFSKEHREFLSRFKIELPKFEYIFWFEKNGIKI